MATPLEDFADSVKAKKHSLRDTVSSESDAYKEIANHVRPAPGIAGVNPNYLEDQSKIIFQTSSSVNNAVRDAETLVNREEASKKLRGTNYKETKEFTEARKLAGQKAHSAIDNFAQHVENVGKDIDTHHQKALEKLDEAVKAGHLTEAQALAHKETLQKEVDTLLAERDDAIKLINKNRETVTKATNVSAKAGTALSTASVAGKSALISNTEYAEKKFLGSKALGKGLTRVKGNWASGGMGKTKVALGALIGVPFLVSGLGDVAEGVGLKSAGKDDKGNELPTDGKLFVGVAKLGAAAGATVLALHGGKGHAVRT